MQMSRQALDNSNNM